MAILPSAPATSTVRLVLDTNVVLDLLHFADPRCAPLTAAQARGEAVFLADTATLAELERVTHYTEFGLDAAGAAALLEAYRRMIVSVEAGAAGRLPRCRDPDDQKFLELAARACADLLVSKDKALLGLKGRQGLTFRILTPSAAAQAGGWLEGES